MEETRFKLREKLVNLEDFFKCAAKTLKKEIKFKYSYFLVPDDEKGDFMTKYSTLNHHIRFTKKEADVFIENRNNNICYPDKAPRTADLFKNISLIKLNWKIKWYGISAIMPIVSEGKIICLILLSGICSKNVLNKNTGNINYLREEITHCLEEIILYNQALERIIRENDNQYKPPVCRVAPSTDEQVPALIGKKTEFL
ncbi:MAG: hypothetical protein ABIH38_04290 [Patescibacteria group bacterium]